MVAEVLCVKKLMMFCNDYHTNLNDNTAQATAIMWYGSTDGGQFLFPGGTPTFGLRSQLAAL
jgi:hypothetical protein